MSKADREYRDRLLRGIQVLAKRKYTAGHEEHGGDLRFKSKEVLAELRQKHDE